MYSIIDETEKFDTSSVVQVFNALKLTPKGKLHYDRDPKSPPPYIARSNETEKPNVSLIETPSKSPFSSSTADISSPDKNVNIVRIDADKHNERNNDSDVEKIVNSKSIQKEDSSAEMTSQMPTIYLNPLQRDKTHIKRYNDESMKPLIQTDMDNRSDKIEDDDRYLGQKLRENWSIDDKEAIVVLERISLMNMEKMRIKGQRVDNELTAMELKRKALVQKRLEEKQFEMKRKSEEHLKIVKEEYLKNVEIYHQREKAQKEMEERQSLELQRQIDEVRVRQQEENRLSKQHRDDRLRLELQRAAEQQLLQKRKQEEARKAQEAEVKRKEEEANLRKLETSKNEAILSATNALSLYSQVFTGTNDVLSKEEGESYLVDTLGISLDVVNTPIVAESISKLSTADNAIVIEKETKELLKLVRIIHSAIDGLNDAKNIALEKRLLEEKIRKESSTNRDVTANSSVVTKESQEFIETKSIVKQNTTTSQISEANLNRYSLLKELKLAFTKRIEQLEDQQGSQIKNTVRKRVNVPVNAIAATNSEHMKDKLIKLRQLLSGNLNIPEATDMKLANDYARNLLAIKFVKQGEVEVSNKRVGDEGFQGFAYAAVISGKNSSIQISAYK